MFVYRWSWPSSFHTLWTRLCPSTVCQRSWGRNWRRTRRKNNQRRASLPSALSRLSQVCQSLHTRCMLMVRYLTKVSYVVRSFLQFSCTSLRESWRRHLQRNRTPSGYYPHGFRRRLCDGFMHVHTYVCITQSLEWVNRDFRDCIDSRWCWEVFSYFGALRDTVCQRGFLTSNVWESSSIGCVSYLTLWKDFPTLNLRMCWQASRDD